jgi:1-deoxy-D-xylulose-5-phosphate synthase
MTVDQLKDVAEEVRWQVLDAVSVVGGHLGAGLGVVDLTVALHAVFDTPRDEIVWDVAHQCQPHKVLTGRRDRIYTLRTGGGLSGFAKRAESEYDAFGAGHSGTSISAAVGFQEAKTKLGLPGHSIAVIGDGAITGGMAWEAMNHAGGLKSKVVVILNDNGQVSLPTNYNTVNTPVGALSQTLGNADVESDGIRIQNDFAKLETSGAFQTGRDFLKSATKSLLPEQLSNAAAKVDEYACDFVKTVPFKGSGAGGKGELFEQLGFYYVGPIDGHNMETLTEVLANIKMQHETGQIQKPVFLHIKTQKGKGYAPAQAARDKLHAVKPKFNLPPTPAAAPAVPAKAAEKPIGKKEPLTKVFADQLVKDAEKDDRIVAITAAMPGGTGVGIFEKRFGPSRTFDVGIAEQHAVTMAASMAAGGLKPFCCIYSTFLQRGYDQVVHDVALQNLPVRFIIDRAGLVGADGATHGGTFDLSFLACIPNMKICAPADEAELVHMVHTIAKIDDCPTALRYPRGNGYGDVETPAEPEFLEPGKGRIVRQGSGGSIALLSVGSRLRECQKAADQLKSYGIDATVADARWIKPLDKELVRKLASEHRALITIEENAIGGFSAQVQQELLEGGFLDGVDGNGVAVRSMMFPDRWIDHHEDQNMQYEDAELQARHIVEKAINVLGRVGVKMEPKVQEKLKK